MTYTRVARCDRRLCDESLRDRGGGPRNRRAGFEALREKWLAHVVSDEVAIVTLPPSSLLKQSESRWGLQQLVAGGRLLLRPALLVEPAAGVEQELAEPPRAGRPRDRRARTRSGLRARTSSSCSAGSPASAPTWSGDELALAEPDLRGLAAGADLEHAREPARGGAICRSPGMPMSSMPALHPGPLPRARCPGPSSASGRSGSASAARGSACPSRGTRPPPPPAPGSAPCSRPSRRGR